VGVNGIHNYAGIIRDYRFPALESEKLSPQEGEQAETTVPALETHEAASSAAGRRQDAELDGISVVFNRRDDFGYIGKDSDIHALDMEKAISDMKKDKVLQQYQYFVGSSRNLYSGSLDGAVRRKL